MVAQAAGVVGSGNEAAAQGVHPGQGRDPACVAEVIGVFASGQGGAGSRLHRHDTGIIFALELVGHEGGNEAAQVGPAAGAAHHDVRILPQLLHGQLGLQADDGLMEQHLIEDGAQHIPLGAAAGHRGLHRLRDGAAQGAGGVRGLLQDLPAHRRGPGGGGGDTAVKDLHDRLAEGLLLVGTLDHVDVAAQAEVAAGLAEGRAPLAGAGLRGNTG